MAGFFKIDYQIRDWRYFGCPSALALWIHILSGANWKDGYFMGTEVPRGTMATSISRLSEETGLHPSTVRKWLKKFQETGEIEVKSTNRFTLIFVVKYSDFQSPEENRVKRNVKQSDKQDDKQSDKRRVDNRRRIEEKKKRIKEKEIIKESSEMTDAELQEKERLLQELNS